MDIPQAPRWQVYGNFGLAISFDKFLARLENKYCQKLANLASFTVSVVKNGPYIYDLYCLSRLIDPRSV